MNAVEIMINMNAVESVIMIYICECSGYKINYMML